MTREDIDSIISIICPNDEDFEKPIISPAYLKKELEALALEQESSGDVISRQAVEDAIYDYSRSCDVNYAQIMEYIDKLPSVKQEPKTGHWIYQKGYVPYKWKCNQCSAKVRTDFNYCPNCGCRMVEPQESETWNGIHAQITAPKGTFERIFNEVDDENDI